MTRHRVDLAELDSVIEQMARFASRLQTALEDADAQVTRLHATWTGAAADEQRAAHQRWRTGAADMHQALAAMRSIAATAHANYSAAAGTNARMWQL